MQEPILCSNCFVNFGVRETAKRLGLNNGQMCPKCGSSNGYLLNEFLTKRLFDIFFLAGTRVTKNMPSPYVSRKASCSPESPMPFAEPTVIADYKLISESIDIELYEGGAVRPYRIGADDYNEKFNGSGLNIVKKAVQDGAIEIDECGNVHIEYIPVEAAEIFVKASKHFSGLTILGNSERLFRVRILNKSFYDDSYVQEFESCPFGKNKGSRFNSKNMQMLYLSSDVATAVLETRPSLNDIMTHSVFLGVYKPIRPLRIFDMTERNSLEYDLCDECEQMDCFIKTLFWHKINRNYIMTQLYSRFIFDQGYDGLFYPSALEKLGTKENFRWCKNIAIFGNPVREGKLMLESVNSILINNIDIDYQFGLFPLG